MEETFGTRTVDEFKQGALASVVSAIRHANALPAPGDDFVFYSSFDGFRHFAQRQGGHIKELVGSLLQQQNINTTWMAHGPASSEDCEEQMESLIEANDSILERVGIMLDEASGVRHAEPVQNAMTTTPGKASPAVASWNKNKTSPGVGASPGHKLIHSKNTLRPQLMFKDPVDNSTAPFLPKLTEKPNAIVPLPHLSRTTTTDGASSAVDMLLSSARQGRSLDPDFHPYEAELLRWEASEDLLEPVKEQLYLNLEDTPLTYIDTAEQLEELCSKLTKEMEIAVDLEAHSYRSFQGFTCLMQISTRSEDFLVDTLKLRSELVMLNEVFTDPKIVKVFHGSDSDVVWLQRDHSLYLVNMFDTGQAARILEMPRFGLAYLLQFYCSVTANKQYQLADWRVRPLPAELTNYAREDTHYLLYIYDRMRNELLTKSNQTGNLLLNTWTRSRDLCLKRYEKPFFKEHSYLILHEKHKKKFNPPQMEALKLLYAWRDKTSRREDESPGYVLPNEMLFQIAQNLPRELQGILACCNPVPLLVRQNVQEMYQLVAQARLVPTNAVLPTLPLEYRKEARKSHTPAKSAPSSATKATPQAKKARKLSEEAAAVPVREFADGFALSGPPIPTAKPKLTALFQQPSKISTKSLMSTAEKAAVDRVLQYVMKAATATPQETSNATATPVTSAREASPNVTPTIGASPMLPRSNTPKTKVDEPMDAESKTGGSESPDHPIWGTPAQRSASVSASKALGEEADESPASKDPNAKPLRSLMSKKPNLKRKHDDTDGASSDDKTTTSKAVKEEEVFEPFDYQKAHQASAESTDQQSSGGRGRGGRHSRHHSAGQAKKRSIDPTKSDDGPSFKTPTRSRVNIKSGERSKTFSGKSSGSNVQWPKR